MELSQESLALSSLLAKFLEDADKKGSVAEAVKNAVLQLKEEAQHHNTHCELNDKGECVNDGQTFVCIGSHVMKILKAAQNMNDPLYSEMDMLQRMQIKQGATTAIHMVK
jgi:hypothetical protein